MDLKPEDLPGNAHDMTKKYIYMLYVIGYVKDWYSYSTNENDGLIEIMITLGNDCNLARVKQRAIAYFDSLGTNRKQIVETQRATDIPSIICKKIIKFICLWQ